MIQNNSADGSSAGVILFESSRLTLDSCEFLHNRAKEDGACIWSNGDSKMI